MDERTPVGARLGASATMLAGAALLLGGSPEPSAAQGEDLGQVLDSLSAGERVRVEARGPGARLKGRVGAREPVALELETSEGRRRVRLADVERLWTRDDHTLRVTLLGIGIGGGFALGSWMFGDAAGGALIGLPAAVAGGLMGAAHSRRRGDWRLRFSAHPEGVAWILSIR